MIRAAAAACALVVASPAAGEGAPAVPFEWFDLDAERQQPDDPSDPFDGTALAPFWRTVDPGPPRWRLEDGRLVVTAGRAPLSGAAPALFGRTVPGERFVATTLLDYSTLEDGDAAGLALWRDADRWVTIQVEKITPAHLVAVRLHDRAGAMPAGRLVATVPVPGHGAMHVRLAIRRQGGALRLLYAMPDSPWQVVGGDLDAAFLDGYPVDTRGTGPTAGPLAGVFAFDGAERD